MLSINRTALQAGCSKALVYSKLNEKKLHLITSVFITLQRNPGSGQQGNADQY